jgi:hypothetical protein
MVLGETALPSHAQQAVLIAPYLQVRELEGQEDRLAQLLLDRAAPISKASTAVKHHDTDNDTSHIEQQHVIHISIQQQHCQPDKGEARANTCAEKLTTVSAALPCTPE